MSRFKAYYRLTKPGIIYGNSLTLIGGFFLASQGTWYGWKLLTVLAGSALTIASACVINNVIDRNLDARMQRTNERATVTGLVKPKIAVVYGTVLGIIGFSVLATFTNLITFIVGLIGFIDYIVLYGYTKRHSIHGTLVGCISGATPIVAGYTAVSSRFDLAALILGAIMVMWQLPHFYAIGLFRIKDYTRVNPPIYPVMKSFASTKNIIRLQIILFVIFCCFLSVAGYTGLLFAVASVLVGLFWLLKESRKDAEPSHWGKSSFLRSLIVILVISVSLPIDTIIR